MAVLMLGWQEQAMASVETVGSHGVVWWGLSCTEILPLARFLLKFIIQP